MSTIIHIVIICLTGLALITERTWILNELGKRFGRDESKETVNESDGCGCVGMRDQEVHNITKQEYRNVEKA